MPLTKVAELRKQAKESGEKISDSTYLIKDRNPLMLIHILHNTSVPPERKDDDPEFVYALSLGFPKDGKNRRAEYVVNTTELRNWSDYSEGVEEDDD